METSWIWFTGRRLDGVHNAALDSVSRYRAFCVASLWESLMPHVQAGSLIEDSLAGKGVEERPG